MSKVCILKNSQKISDSKGHDGFPYFQDTPLLIKIVADDDADYRLNSRFRYVDDALKYNTDTIHALNLRIQLLESVIDKFIKSS
jgi:stress-induced morphogen